MFLDGAIKVDIAGQEVHESAGHSINHTARHVRLNDQGTSSIEQEYGSVKAFIEEKQVDRGTSTQSSDPESARLVDSQEQAGDLRPPDTADVTISRVIRNTRLAKDLKARYNHQCQVCGERREKGSGEPYSEVHHLQPLGHERAGPDADENMLVLCPNYQADFDFGTIRVDPETMLVEYQYEGSLDDEKLSVGDDHTIAEEYPQFHNEKIASF